MELALLAGLGALGWGLSAKGTGPRDSTKTPPVLGAQNAFPFDQDTVAAGLLADDVDTARRHVMRVYNPATGKYTFDAEKVGYGPASDPQFNVRSDKTTAAVNSQQRLELFTGADSAWKPKREREAVFKPEETRSGLVASGGTAHVPPSYERDRRDLEERGVFATRQNNVTPFEQVRVGPGIGVGVDVPAADGYQSRFRVLPTESLNPHRINQLPGVAPSGGVQRGFDRGSRRFENFTAPRRSLVEHSPGVTGAKTAANAPAWMPMPDLKPTKSQGSSREYFGPGHKHDAGSVVRPEVSNVCKLGPTTYPVLGQSSNLKARTAPLGHVRKVRRRQACQPVVQGAHVTAKADRRPTNWVLKQTARENSTCGGSGAFVGGGRTMAPGDVSSSGLREQSADNTGVSSALKKPTAAGCYNLGPGRETDGRTEIGRLPGGLVPDDPGSVRLKIKPNAYGECPAGGAVLSTAQQRADVGCIVSKRKVPSTEPRTQTLGLGLFGC